MDECKPLPVRAVKPELPANTIPPPLGALALVIRLSVKTAVDLAREFPAL